MYIVANQALSDPTVLDGECVHLLTRPNKGNGPTSNRT